MHTWAISIYYPSPIIRPVLGFPHFPSLLGYPPSQGLPGPRDPRFCFAGVVLASLPLSPQRLRPRVYLIYTQACITSLIGVSQKEGGQARPTREENLPVALVRGAERKARRICMYVCYMGFFTYKASLWVWKPNGNMADRFFKKNTYCVLFNVVRAAPRARDHPATPLELSLVTAKITRCACLWCAYQESLLQTMKAFGTQVVGK